MIKIFSKEKDNPFSNSSLAKETEFNNLVISKIKNRRSIRSYKKEKPDFKHIYNILDCSFNSPSAGNILNYSVVLVEEKNKILDIARACENQIWINEAPYVLVVLSNDKLLEDNYPKDYEKFSNLNSGAFINTIINTATLFNLNSCWIGAFDKTEISKIINCDENEISGLITIGFSDETPNKRLIDISTKVNFESKGNLERVSLDVP